MRQFHNWSVFSKINIVKAYYQVPVSSSDIEKTAITTPFGLFEYVRMLFCLRNASQTFQRYMDTIFRDLYIDDILVASLNKREHINHLRQVLQRLSDNELRISLESQNSKWMNSRSWAVVYLQVEFNLVLPMLKQSKTIQFKLSLPNSDNSLEWPATIIDSFHCLHLSRTALLHI